MKMLGEIGSKQSTSDRQEIKNKAQGYCTKTPASMNFGMATDIPSKRHSAVIAHRQWTALPLQ
jgi:hypothetical protein